jgi:hypothetical protein
LRFLSIVFTGATQRYQVSLSLSESNTKLSNNLEALSELI